MCVYIETYAMQVLGSKSSNRGKNRKTAFNPPKCSTVRVPDPIICEKRVGEVPKNREGVSHPKCERGPGIEPYKCHFKVQQTVQYPDTGLCCGYMSKNNACTTVFCAD
jgi:hypothetical protein